MQLTWKASESASAIHAALAAEYVGSLAPAGLNTVLAPLIADPPTANHGDQARLLAMLLQLAAQGVELNSQLAEQALTKLWGREAAVPSAISALAAWIASLERAYYDWRHAQSERQLVDEIITRTAPIRDQWDARGPGIMRQFGRLADRSLVASEATVVMVLPALGGDGMAHLTGNLVTFEAVLTDGDPRLPEVVRLAWLLAQLQFDLPPIAEQIPAGRLGEIAQLAVLPALLEAATAVELVPPEPTLLSHAIAVWRIASVGQAESLADVVQQWWNTYLAKPVAWPVAAAALAAMLPTDP